MATMNGEKPPLGSPRSTTSSESESAPRSSLFGGRKSQRTSTSDSPSGSASNARGRSVFNRRLRSVLSHPLGLPLFDILHDKKNSTLSFLGTDSKKAFTDGADAASKNKKLDAILKTAVDEWVKKFPTKREREEPQLTKLMSSMIEKEYRNTGFHSDAEVNMKYENQRKPSRIDILFSPEKAGSTGSSTPLAIIEVGRDDLDWWKKVDQNFKYLVSLGNHQPDNRLRFKKPLLFAVLTIEGEAEAQAQQQLRIKLGIFLCSPKDPKNPQDDFRMTLLSHFNTRDLQEASKAFGQLLRATSLLSRWRESANKTVGSYEYFSSNCCRFGQYVFRSYDSRFRPTNRSPEIYLSPDCRDIVGPEATEVAKFPEDFDTAAFNHGDNGRSCVDDSFWSNKSPGRGLLIIATPYRSGRHVAKSPKAFLPVIAHLELLHKKGFVHGDIRAFNTVFGEQDNEGWLIDFDFGGQIGSTCYPNGYRRNLDDGLRIGVEKEKIEKWHDWYALGRLIFYIHRIVVPKGVSQELVNKYIRISSFWTDIGAEPCKSDKDELKSFLREIGEQGWQVTPCQSFRAAVKNNTSPGPIRGTYKGATGSPPEKKH